MELNLLTPAEAGALMRKSPGTLAIWRCARRYPLSYIGLGNRIFYRRRDVEEFIESCVVSGKEHGKRPPIVRASTAHREEMAREGTAQS
jgi:hypothetical protein